MIKNVLNTVEKYNMINTHDKIILGLSGGADSIALLYVLLKLKEVYNLEITAVHVNHQLRGQESQRDENFVKNKCNALNVEIIVVNCPVLEKSKELKLTIEEAGRLVRYNVFEKICEEKNANKIAVAHNLNDQAETLVMNFFRGSGLKGLTGIPAVRGKIIRPLIKCKREEIEDFCKVQHIEYITDSSNKSLDYTRNKVRLELLPYIKKEFNHNIVDTLVRNVEIFSSEEDYIYKQAVAAHKSCVNTTSGVEKINLTKFLKNHDAIQRRVIRISILNSAKTLKGFSNEHINMIMLLAKKNTGKSVNLPHGLKAEISYNTLIIYKPDPQEDYLYDIKIGSFTHIKELDIYISCQQKKVLLKDGFINTCTKVFNYDKIIGEITLRNRRPGDKIHIKSAGSKKIKDYFINEKVPRNERDKIPMLLNGSNVMWIIPKLSTTYKEVVSYMYNTKTLDVNKIYIQLWEETK